MTTASAKPDAVNAAGLLRRAAAMTFDLMDGHADLAGLRDTLSAVGGASLDRRLDGLLGQFTDLDTAVLEDRVRDLARRAALVDGGLRPYAEFSTLIETEITGLVVTAHPTFSLSPEASDHAGQYLRAAVGEAPAPAGPFAAGGMRPLTAPTLDQEMIEAEAALMRMRHAIRRATRIVLDVAAELYPDDWRALKPCFMTLASWVGFDMDGRTDIGWEKSLIFRYRLALVGLDELETSLDQCGSGNKNGADPALADGIASIRPLFATLRTAFEAGQKAVEAEQATGEDLGAFNRMVVDNRATKEDAIDAIDAALDALLAALTDPATALDVATLRAEWLSLGLGLSRLHFRVNAVQLHNAVRAEIALDKEPDESASRRHYLKAISKLLDKVEPQSIHYGTVNRELTTAKRVFMLAAQFLKHFDGRTPIRMLVAESDTPFTLLTALYYARLFDVDEWVEISPLFETAIGLQRGDRVIAELLDNPHFLRYLKKRGRFAVQLGFSDSGRYVGQPAATLAIERFKIRLIQLWKARGLGDVQLLFFDTHGESIGRGAHPASLRDRFLYVHSARVRSLLAELETPHKHEVSFQGGDGYLWFRSDTTAFATVVELLHARLDVGAIEDDALYANSGWSLDFFLTLKEFQEDLAAMPGYVHMLDTIASHFLYPTGSRAVRRQGGSSGAPRLENISQVRAIPHNAMLQQLGFMANSCAGFGTAIARAPDRFQDILEGSKRLQRIVSLAETAQERSLISILVAYGDLAGPNHWLDLADRTDDPDRREALSRLSEMLEQAFNHEPIQKTIRVLRRDLAAFEDLTAPMGAGRGMNAGEADPDLVRLHEMRLALIGFIYLKAMEVPRFSSRLDISLEDLVVRLLHVDITETVATLRGIFPVAVKRDDHEAYGEKASFDKGRTRGYAVEHQEIFDPLEEAFNLILEISSVIGLRNGAFG